MIAKEVLLPQGSLGLELEPLLTGGGAADQSRAVGCRVRAWRTDSTIPAATQAELPPGAIITGVDGVSVDRVLFQQVVSRIGSSASRRLCVLQIPGPSDSKGDTHQSATLDNAKELFQSSIDCVESLPADNSTDFSSVSDRWAAAAAVCTDRPHESEEEGCVSDPTDVKPPVVSSVDVRKIDRAKDGKVLLLSGRVSSQRQELQRARADISQLQRDLDGKEALVAAMRADIGGLKKNNRNKDGKITLLSFQLDKIRLSPADDVSEAAQLSANTVESGLPNATTEADRVLHYGKWKHVMSLIDEADRDFELRKQLLLQSCVNKRLEAQMRAWMEAQISLQKELAVQDADTILRTEAALADPDCSKFPTAAYSCEPSRPVSPNAASRGAQELEAALSPVSESEMLLKRYSNKIVHIFREHSFARKRNESSSKENLAPAPSDMNGQVPPQDTYTKTPIMTKLLHPSKKRAVTVENNDSKPSQLDMSFEFIDHIGSTRSQSEQSVLSSTSEETCNSSSNNLNLSVYPLTPNYSNERRLNSQCFTSPTIIKLSDQMNKLRGQNASIRSDLQKFRGMIQKVKVEVNSL